MATNITDRLGTRPQQVAAKVVDGEAILINLSTGMYYSMGKVGGRVWSLIEMGLPTRDIIDGIATEFDVPIEQATTDVQALVDQLIEEELVDVETTVNGAAPPGRPTVEFASSNEVYATPELSKFSDMAEMFALDPPLPGLAKTTGG